MLIFVLDENFASSTTTAMSLFTTLHKQIVLTSAANHQRQNRYAIS